MHVILQFVMSGKLNTCSIHAECCASGTLPTLPTQAKIWIGSFQISVFSLSCVLPNPPQIWFLQKIQPSLNDTETGSDLRHPVSTFLWVGSRKWIGMGQKTRHGRQETVSWLYVMWRQWGQDDCTCSDRGLRWHRVQTVALDTRESHTVIAAINLIEPQTCHNCLFPLLRMPAYCH